MSGESQTTAWRSLSPELKAAWDPMRTRREAVKSQRSRLTGSDRNV